jgi:curved DNA-binding protein CbpA
MMAADPYSVLGVTSTVTDVELRAAYRRLVKLHHPDHNRGSADAAARFEAVQAAYAQVLQLRAAGAGRTARAAASSTNGSPRTTTAPRTQTGGSEMDARIAAMEREISERRSREQARLQAEAERRQAQADAARARTRDKAEGPSREELGYVDSDDSFSSILADALDQVAERLAPKHKEQ